MATPDLRGIQVGLRAQFEAELRAFFRSLVLTKPEAARDAMLAFVPALVQRYGTAAAAVAAAWYDELRFDRSVPGRFRAIPVVPEALTIATIGTVRRAAGYLFTETPEQAFDSMVGPTGKHVLSAARETILKSTEIDPKSTGWQRVTRPDSCKFCRMLADRGARYTRATADFAAHTNCNCAARPVWDKSIPEVDVRMYEMSKQTARMSEAQRERHRAAVRRYLATMPD